MQSKKEHDIESKYEGRLEGALLIRGDGLGIVGRKGEKNVPQVDPGGTNKK